MKKIFLLLTPYFLLLAASATAQQPGYEPHDIKTETQYKWGIGVQVNTITKTGATSSSEYAGAFDDSQLYDGKNTKDNSYSLGLIGSYYIGKITFLQVKFGLTNINITLLNNFSDSLYNYLSDLGKKQLSFHLSYGIGWDFIKNDKFKLYGGIKIPFNLYGKIKFHKFSYQYEINNSSLYYSLEENGTQKNGFSLGVGSFMGFLINLNKRISFGPECSFAFLYSKLGGDGTLQHIEKGTINKNESFRYKTNFVSSRISDIIASLNISVGLGNYKNNSSPGF